MAFTAGNKHAGSNDLPSLTVHLKNYETGSARFPNRPGDDQQRNKGDFWRFNIRKDLHLKKWCITESDIKAITVVNGGKDEWRIQSIVTILRSGAYFSIVTADIDINRAIDQEPKISSNRFKQISLTKTYTYY